MANFKEYGFIDVVTKPYKMKDMSETLKRVLAQSNQ